MRRRQKGFLSILIAIIAAIAILSYFNISLRSLFESERFKENLAAPAPELWLSHDDWDGKSGQLSPDVLERWRDTKSWDTTLRNMDVYTIGTALIEEKRGGEELLNLLKSDSYFGPNATIDDYFRLVIPVLKAYGIKLQLHSGGGSRQDYVCEPNDPDHRKAADANITWISRINNVGLEYGGYKVEYVKLQSLLSGNRNNGLPCNVAYAVFFMQEIDAKFSGIKFILGDAMEQRREPGRKRILTWRDAYKALYDALQISKNKHLNLVGVRVEGFANRNECEGETEDPEYRECFRNSSGFDALVGTAAEPGLVDVVHSLGWKVGFAHNCPPAQTAEEFQSCVLLTGEVFLDREIPLDFVGFGNGMGDDEGVSPPQFVTPEAPQFPEPPTMSSIFLKLAKIYGRLQ